MIKPGEVDLIDANSGKRPAVVVSREELNRGRRVVAVPITSARFEERSGLPHRVPSRAGEFGMTKDCVAQAEAITFLERSDLDLDAGLIGELDEDRLRDLTRAVGHMMGSECEPE